ncbi:MAG: signal peptidase I [Candidatus Gastranaerophilales bacterium]|nr:signal peptidase I [Candidatus Gastranaerophilales bacterium]
MQIDEIKLKIKAGFKEAIETAAFVIIMVILIRFFIGEIRWIPSGSMRPTLIEGDRIFVERVSRFFTTPKRGDIMVFYPPMEPLDERPLAIFERLTGFFCKDIAYIKRVIGLPGDKILIKPDKSGEYKVFVNNKQLQEKYILDNYDYIPCTERMYCGPFTVPKDNYFMLGDNRGNSQDSRFWGFLPRERFVGKAVVLFWPFTRMKGL